MSTALSTPISQLKNNQNIQPPAMDDDPMVQDVINSLVKEVKTADVKSTPIATFQPQQYFQQSPQHYQQQQQQQHNNSLSTSNKLMEEWMNQEDAKTSIIIALIALAIFYQRDLSELYEKFELLTRFKQYDIFIRAGLLALILYVILRKFKHIL
jgi:hypothetical protein